jgi:hypothetical protein
VARRLILPPMDFKPEHSFDAELELESESGGVFFVLPFSVAEAYGTRGQLPVDVRIDGFPYRTTLFREGDGTHTLVVPRPVRGAIGKTWGHTVRVELARDNAPRYIEPPADLAEALLLVPGARARYDKMSYTHQREYVRWIEGAKKEETRRRRLEQAAEMIAAGKKRA